MKHISHKHPKKHHSTGQGQATCSLDSVVGGVQVQGRLQPLPLLLLPLRCTAVASRCCLCCSCRIVQPRKAVHAHRPIIRARHYDWRSLRGGTATSGSE